MTRCCLLTLLFLLALFPHPVAGQKAAPHAPASLASHALALARAGQCPQALPLLQRALANATSQSLRRQLGMQGLSCAMTLNQPETGLKFLLPLQREYPHDPEVLYLATHVYSDLSIHASRALILFAPDSYQVHELNAEALEVRGEWQKAEGEYRIVLNKDPDLPGIHYRIGRLLLSEPPAQDAAVQQKRLQQAGVEFEDELKIDPSNAGAEFVLGELARQAAQWPRAIEHFSRASRLDPHFTDAFIALGETRMDAHDFAAAVAPLQVAERQQPGNPTPHFLLANAYLRGGHRADAEREQTLYQQSSKQAQAAKDRVQKQLMKDEQSLQP